MKRTLSMLLALLLCFSLVACTDSPASTPTPTQTPANTPASGTTPTPPVENTNKMVETLTYGVRNPSWDLSPWKNNGSTANAMWLLLYSSLLTNPAFGTALEDMHLDMAESVDISSDKLTATVKLRDYIHDSKGNPIKAEDVVFSYETAPKTSGVYARVGSLLASIAAINEHTVEMKINKFTPGTWESLLSNCPIVSKSWYESASDDEKANDPATTGVYYVKENIPGTSAEFAVVENFWQKDELKSVYQTTNVRVINFICIAEDAMRVIALENGEIDIAYLENSSAARFANNEDFSVFETAMCNPSAIGINGSESSPFYNNPALRKAVLHAIDMDQVRLACSGDFGFLHHDIAPAICGDYDPAWDQQPYFDYDPELAKQYLAEAGYSENSGLTLRFIFRNVSGMKSASVVMQSNLKDIGINLELYDYDQALFDTYTADPTQWDMIWFTAMMTTGFVTESWDWYFGSRGDQGTVGFIKDDTLQQLLETAKTKNDAASRNAFRDYVLDQGYAAGMYMDVGYTVAQSYITDMRFGFSANALVNTCVFSDDYTG